MADFVVDLAVELAAADVGHGSRHAAGRLIVEDVDQGRGFWKTPGDHNHGDLWHEQRYHGD